MAVYGYARVSSIEQDLSIQKAALQAAGCQVIRAEKKSGSQRAGRKEFETLLDFLQEGHRALLGHGFTVVGRPSDLNLCASSF